MKRKHIAFLEMPSVPETQETETVDYKKMPKIELHAHLNGSLSMSTVQRLYDLSLNQGNDVTQLPLSSSFSKEPENMDDVFKMFPIIQRLTTTYEAVKMATMDVISDYCDDGTVYLELRTTPRETEHMTRKEYVDAVIDGIRGSSHLSIVVRLLLSIDRKNSVEDALQTVTMAANDESGLIVGVDVSGNPSIDGRPLLPVLEKARRSGLRVAVHLAEVSDCLEEVDDFLSFSPDRIGHGTFLSSQEKWVEQVTQRSIPIEVCLTSNVFCRTTPNFESSHFSFWKSQGVPVLISRSKILNGQVNTDDQGLMSTSLSNEYRIAASTFGLSVNDLLSITRAALDVSFIDKQSPDYIKIRNIIDYCSISP